MADRSHLTPVRTTDKNGRGTTVYRNQAAAGNPAAAKASVPAPAAPVLPGVLREPEPLPTAELEEVAVRLARTSRHPMDFVRAMIVEEPAGRTAAALAAEAHAGGVLTKLETRVLLLFASDQGVAAERSREGAGAKVAAVLGRDALRVAARIAARHPERDPRWAGELIEAVKGARRNRMDELETEAQLDSLAAVVEFTMEVRDLGDFTEINHGGITDSGSTGHRALTSTALEGLLRERPHDLDRVLQYIAERDIHVMDSAEDVEDLRAWLNATRDSPSLGDGWL